MKNLFVTDAADSTISNFLVPVGTVMSTSTHGINNVDLLHNVIDYLTHGTMHATVVTVTVSTPVIGVAIAVLTSQFQRLSVLLDILDSATLCGPTEQIGGI